MAKRGRKPKWRAEVEEQDFAAAESYLQLVFSSKRSVKLVAALRAQAPARFKAKDVFRASQLSLLGVSNSHVGKDREKIRAGTPLSPILLVRDAETHRLIVADGYHRLCAIYELDEDAWIPCRIVSA